MTMFYAGWNIISYGTCNSTNQKLTDARRDELWTCLYCGSRIEKSFTLVVKPNQMAWCYYIYVKFLIEISKRDKNCQNKTHKYRIDIYFAEFS